MDHLLPLAAQVGERLKARKQTIGVAESSAGGLISALLLSVPGASAYFIGGGVIYTPRARAALMQISRETLGEARSQSEDYALLLARSVRGSLGADWGLGETGATGPTGRAGRTALAISNGETELSFVLETGRAERVENMYAFAQRALELILAATDERDA